KTRATRTCAATMGERAIGKPQGCRSKGRGSNAKRTRELADDGEAARRFLRSVVVEERCDARPCALRGAAERALFAILVGAAIAHVLREQVELAAARVELVEERVAIQAKTEALRAAHRRLERLNARG